MKLSVAALRTVEYTNESIAAFLNSSLVTIFAAVSAQTSLNTV
jgi:hypothetical protein